MDVGLKKLDCHFFRNNIVLKQQFDQELLNIQEKE